jgi:hemerythrin-like metal-binding protein
MVDLESFHPIEWTESMATGIGVIDKQHQYLVDTLQEVNSKLMADDGNLFVGGVVKDLLGYAITHFEIEESLMQRYGYATAYPVEAHAHISQHRDFSRQVVAIGNRLREGEVVSRIEVLRFLNHWLQCHVLGIDQHLGAFLRQKVTLPDVN